jgi:hypothetical protein
MDPGTNRDIDFYSARATGESDEMPPTDHWSIKQHGRAQSCLWGMKMKF